MRNFLLSSLLLFGIVYGYSQNEGVVAPINPEYAKYLDKLNSGQIVNQTKDGHRFGYVPSPVKPNFDNYYKLNKSLLKRAFPASYDLRTLGFVTSVKNQGQCGTCWAFATCASIESRWLKLGLGAYNLSEDNMKDCHNFDIGNCDGGFIELATAYLVRRSGPALETSDPYYDTPETCPSNVLPTAYVTDARFLPADINTIKEALMDYGGIYTAFYYADSYYNSSNYTYYCGTANSANHAVLIAGWDDNKQTAGGKGAWIIKNSWGTAWGESGYFYISYNDATVLEESAYFPLKIDYQASAKVYNYDDFGWIASYGFQSEAAYGLVKFITTNTNPLVKAGTWINTSNTVIDIDIYDNFNGTSLTNLLGSMHNLSCPFPGYYTFSIPSSIALANGNDFYIKIKYITPGNTSPIPIEISYPGIALSTIETGKCWISSNGSSWNAIGKNTTRLADLCIKAYTDNSCNYPQATITPHDSIILCQGQTTTLTANSGTEYKYQWQKTDLDISGATNISYSPAESGNYRVLITNSNNCSNTSLPVNVAIYSIEAGNNQSISCNGKAQLNPSINYTTGKFIQLYKPTSFKFSDIILASFGANIQSNCVAGNLAYVKDNNSSYLGCSATGYPTGVLSNKIALIDRGSCEFGYKALKAQQNGAKAVIICNSEANNGPNTSSSLGAGSYGSQVTIPVLMVSQSVGNYFKTFLTGSGYAKVSIGYDAGAFNVQWSPSAGLSETDIFNPVASPKITTTYTLSISNTECALADKVTISVTNAPSVNLGKDSILTEEKSMTLNAGVGFTSYDWNDGSKNQTLAVNSSDLTNGVYIYSVTVTNSSGCQGIDSIKITVEKQSGYKVNGFITYDNNLSTPLKKGMIYLCSPENLKLDSSKLDTLGYYNFNKVQNGIYKITAKISQTWGGATPVDALYLNRTYIGLYSFKDDLKKQAADVSFDNKISPVDALLINRRYIKALNSFKSGDWVFENATITVNGSNVTTNFKTICFGDVNGDYKF